MEEKTLLSGKMFHVNSMCSIYLDSAYMEKYKFEAIRSCHKALKSDKLIQRCTLIRNGHCFR